MTAMMTVEKMAMTLTMVRLVMMRMLLSWQRESERRGGDGDVYVRSGGDATLTMMTVTVAMLATLE